MLELHENGGLGALERLERELQMHHLVEIDELVVGLCRVPVQ